MHRLSRGAYPSASFLFLIMMMMMGLLSGCGGGGDREAFETAEQAALEACLPAEAAPGEKITCSVGKDFRDSCTFFVGESAFEAGDEADERHYAWNEAEGTVEAVLPQGLSGDSEIYTCCGDCEKTRLTLDKSFSILVAGAKGESHSAKKSGSSGKPADPSKTTSGTTEEVIVPPGGVPAGAPPPAGGGTGPVAAGEKDSDGDGVADVIDSCPGTAVGSSVNSVGCSAAQQTPATPPAGASASIASFTVQSAGSGSLFGVYTLSWNVTNAKKLLMWGNIFNREAEDANLVAAQQCGKTAGRYLLTKSDGHNWAGTETAFPAAFATGSLCQGEDPDAKGCPFKAPGSSYRIEPLESRGVFAFKPVEIHKTIVVKDLFEVAPVEPHPKCRIDLMKGEAPVASGTFTTRSLVGKGTVCLSAQGGDGVWKTACKDVAGPKPTLAPIGGGIQVSSATPVVSLSLHYDNLAGGLTVTGCKKGGKPDASGSGDYVDECPIVSDTTQIEVTARGVGSQVAKRTYTLEFKNRGFALFQVQGSMLPTDDPGTMPIKYKIKRDWELKEDGKIIDTGEAPWAKKIKFHGQYVIDKQTRIDPEIEIKKASDANGTITASRDSEHSYWYASVYGFEDNEWGGTSSTVSHPIPIHFDRSLKTNGSEGSQPCLGILVHAFKWTGRNIKSVSVSGATIAGGTLPKEVKGEQGGEITILDVAPMGPGSHSMEFTWHVVDLWGKTHNLTPLPGQASIGGWECH